MPESYAFRCKNCGHLEHAGHAGERDVPLTCRVCRRGVKYNPDTGERTTHPDNWEVLAKATNARLAELGLKRAQVVAHDGKKFAAEALAGRELSRTAGDGPGSKDGA